MKALLRNRVMATMALESGGAKEEPTTSSTITSSSSSSSLLQQQNVCPGCGRSMSQQNLEETASTSRFPPSILLCEACKKFYSRYRTKIREERCTCGGSSVVPLADDKCRACRFQRCEIALLEKKTLATIKPVLQPDSEKAQDKVDFTKLPCAVCGFSSSGFHFGVVSCEGCKGFFRRSMNKCFKIQYVCKGVKEGRPPKALCPASSNCRKCRLQRCINAGMSTDDISLGRHTIRRQAEIEAAIKRHSIEGTFLKAKRCRRRRQLIDNKEDGDIEIQVSPSSSSMTLSAGMDFNSCSSSQPQTSLNAASKQASASTVTVNKVVSSPTSTPQTPIQNVSATTSIVNLDVGPGSNTQTTASSSTDCSSITSLDKHIQSSTEWFTDRTAEAAAKLSQISAIRLYLDPQMTKEQHVVERVRSFDNYVRCISEFSTSLPGISLVAVQDRITLFTQALYPISIAQLSLDFDVQTQIPNHFSLDRVGPTWEICAREEAEPHFATERFLCEVGNQLASANLSFKQFSLLCALLFFNPDTQNLHDGETIRSVRRRYELTVLQSFVADYATGKMEERLGKFYQLITCLRRSTMFFRNFFVSIAPTRSQEEVSQWTPLFKQIFSQLISLPVVDTSAG